jgi:hypothetical protein
MAIYDAQDFLTSFAEAVNESWRDGVLLERSLESFIGSRRICGVLEHAAMSRGISRQKVQTAVIKGIENAFRQYTKWSSLSLDDAPEFYVACKIAEHIARPKFAGRNTITLEEPIRNALREGRAQGVGRPRKELSKKGRFDIVLWNKSTQTPRAIVGVKSPLFFAEKTRLRSDARRICLALRRGSSKKTIRFGILAFYAAVARPNRKFGTADQRLKALVQRMFEEVKNCARGLGCAASRRPVGIHRGTGKSAWTAGCFVITSSR